MDIWVFCGFHSLGCFFTGHSDGYIFEHLSSSRSRLFPRSRFGGGKSIVSLYFEHSASCLPERQRAFMHQPMEQGSIHFPVSLVHWNSQSSSFVVIWWIKNSSSESLFAFLSTLQVEQLLGVFLGGGDVVILPFMFFF